MSKRKTLLSDLEQDSGDAKRRDVCLDWNLVFYNTVIMQCMLRCCSTASDYRNLACLNSLTLMLTQKGTLLCRDAKRAFSRRMLIRESPISFATVLPNGWKHGLEQTWHCACQVAEEYMWEDNERHGVAKTWCGTDCCGACCEVDVSDELVATRENYHELHYDGYYVHDKPHGKERFWHYSNNTQMAIEVHWLEGLLHGIEREWYEDGTLLRECTWRYDRAHGVEREWYEDGTLQYECTWIYGLLHGVEWLFHGNGKLHRKRRWNVGKIRGTVQFWNERGDSISHCKCTDCTQHNSEPRDFTKWIDWIM